MPPKKMKSRQAPNASTAAALADCEDLMLCILTRLPVKSIVRFKSVCKRWNHLFSTQEFIKIHQLTFSNNPKNQSFMAHTINKHGSNIIAVFNIETNEKKAKILDHPFKYTIDIDIVGCLKGLVCIRLGKGFVLWNPAINLSKTVPPLKDQRAFESSVSLGFGYDAEGDDFKVVRIWINKGRVRMSGSCVEVYFVNSDSWTTIDPGFQFQVLRTANDGIVNGNPYWVVRVDGNNVLMCFDTSKSVFKNVPLSTLDYDELEADVEFVDWNGRLGALVFTYEINERIEYVPGSWEFVKRVEYVHAWVFDDGEQIWTKKQSVGPIEVKIDRVLKCLKDGRVLGKRPNGQLIVFDPETRCVKGLFNGAPEGRFEIYGYTESLANIEGMERVTMGKM